MPVIPLSEEPSLTQLRKQAKELRRGVLAGDQAALAEVAGHYPDRDPAGEFPLHAAQLVLARHYGFTSWARLERRVEVSERYSRFPAPMTAGDAPDLADSFLRLVCLYFGDDEPEQRARGRRLLAEHPEITRDSVYAAAAAADYLVEHGAPPLDLDPADAFIAAILAADRPVIDRLQREHPGLVGQVRSARPALVTWAAACGRPQAAEILVELGFDVNARGRTDVPSDQPWQTALHKAAEDGNVELARTLLRLGADPDVRDHRFDSTPLGWARYFGQQPLIDLLEPLTTPGEPPVRDTDDHA